MIEGRVLSVGRGSGLVLVALCWALFLTLTGSPEAVLFTVPVFLLAAPLAFGRYLGEDILAAVAARPRRFRRAAGHLFDLPRAEFRPAGLIDAALASGRAPPLAS